MNISLSHTVHRTPYIVCRMLFFIAIVLLISKINLSAQRLEVHANKDLSTNATANRAWGVGGAIDFDEWIKRTTFRVNFNWAMFREKDDRVNPNYQRLSGGISAFYSFKVIEKLTFYCGAEINYSNLRHSYIHGLDTINKKAITLQQTGNFVGIGPHLSLQYELSSRFNVALNFIPTYLIPVSFKSSIKATEPEYKKGIWLFQIQLGLSYKLFKPD